jgi:hypothetical protein
MDPPASVDNDLLRVTVAPHGNLRVCAAFFRHVVGCSTTFIPAIDPIETNVP